MNRNRIFTFCTIAVTIMVMTACAVTSHPNEKMIVGTWRPVKVEKVVDSSALQAAASLAGNPAQKQSKTGSPSGDGGAARKDAALDRMVQAQMRATMEISAKKTVVLNFPAKPVNATWKMKGNGTRIVARGVENKKKYVLEILEISKEQMVVLENTPAGDLKITFVRQM